ncbi:MAG: hypothetical protein V4710_09300 [Verrucomicrobiota bacterium]
MASHIKEESVPAALFALLRCPETHQTLAIASRKLIDSLEAARLAGALCDQSGNRVEYAIEVGLVRRDEKRFYPIREGLPVLLIGESIALPLQA